MTRREASCESNHKKAKIMSEEDRNSKKLINEMHPNAFRVAGEQRDSER